MARTVVDIKGKRVLRILDFNDAEFAKESKRTALGQGPRDPFENASTLEAQGTGDEPLEEDEMLEDDDDDDWTDESSSEFSLLDGDDDRIKGFRGMRIPGTEARHRCEQLRIAYEPSYLVDNAVFESKLETRLPFRWTLSRPDPNPEKDVVGTFLRVMIDDEHVIGIKVGDTFSLLPVQSGLIAKLTRQSDTAGEMMDSVECVSTC